MPSLLPPEGGGGGGGGGGLLFGGGSLLLSLGGGVFTGGGCETLVGGGVSVGGLRGRHLVARFDFDFFTSPLLSRRCERAFIERATFAWLRLWRATTGDGEASTPATEERRIAREEIARRFTSLDIMMPVCFLLCPENERKEREMTEEEK
jgi:hypothetical protein